MLQTGLQSRSILAKKRKFSNFLQYFGTIFFRCIFALCYVQIFQINKNDNFLISYVFYFCEKLSPYSEAFLTF